MPEDEKKQETLEQDEFNPTLAAMEEEIKPKIISTINVICKHYTKFPHESGPNRLIKGVLNL